jgi:hypothetical protein
LAQRPENRRAIRLAAQAPGNTQQSDRYGGFSHDDFLSPKSNSTIRYRLFKVENLSRDYVFSSLIMPADQSKKFVLSIKNVRFLIIK